MKDSCYTLQTRGGWNEDFELQRCKWPIGPRNTWSNVAYPLVGWGTYGIAASGDAAAFAVAMTALGIGSGLYHALKTRWSNRLDWVGMYMAFSALVVHGIVPGHPLAPWIMLSLGGVVAWYFSYVLNGIDLNGQMGLFFVLSGLRGLLGLTQYAVLAWGALATLCVAYAVWNLDRRGETGLWGHAFWHVLTAVAMGMLFFSQV